MFYIILWCSIVMRCIIICRYVCMLLYIVLFHIDTCYLCRFILFCNVWLYSFVFCLSSFVMSSFILYCVYFMYVVLYSFPIHKVKENYRYKVYLSHRIQNFKPPIPRLWKDFHNLELEWIESFNKNLQRKSKSTSSVPVSTAKYTSCYFDRWIQRWATK